MKQILIYLLCSILAIHCYCQQGHRFTTADYAVEIHFFNIPNADSSLVKVYFNNKGNKPVFILDTFNAKFDVKNTNLDIYFGEEFVNSHDSTQPMRQIKPGLTDTLTRRIPKYFSGTSWVRLLCSYVYPETPSFNKEVFVRKDFPRWEDYREFNYSFLITCN